MAVSRAGRESNRKYAGGPLGEQGRTAAKARDCDTARIRSVTEGSRPGALLGMKRGTTLAELLVVLAILSGIAALGAPLLHRALDRGAVERAAVDVSVAHRMARALAQHRGGLVTLTVSAESLTIVVTSTGGDVVWQSRAGPASRGVSLVASRAEVAFGPNGIGWGASNTTIRLSRGTAAAVLVASRLGRLRRIE